MPQGAPFAPDALDHNDCDAAVPVALKNQESTSSFACIRQERMDAMPPKIALLNPNYKQAPQPIS